MTTPLAWKIRSSSTSTTLFEVLRGIDKPITQAMHDEDLRAKLEALRVSLKGAATTAGDMISRRRRPHFRVQCHGRRLNMTIDRRELLIGAASSAALSRSPWHRAKAARSEELFAAARRDDRGTYSAALFSLDGGDVRAVELPERGHDIALRPGSWRMGGVCPQAGSASASPCRPTGASRSGSIRSQTGISSAMASTRPTARLLYTAENDYQNARGIIGVRDATAGYRQIGEFPARGMEPHDVALLADGRTMVIANGGIKTHPDSGADELNLPDMKPSLVYVDLATGDLLEEQMLAPELHQLSIRHLALAAGGTVVFGCQYRGPEDDAPPLLGFHRRGEQPVIVPAPADAQTALKNYIGSVSADSAGGIVAASAPKGGLITYWDVAAGGSSALAS
jgi:hypothetical protein